MISEFINCKVSASGDHWVNALKYVRMVLVRLGSVVMQSMSSVTSLSDNAWHMIKGVFHYWKTVKVLWVDVAFNLHLIVLRVSKQLYRKGMLLHYNLE